MHWVAEPPFKSIGLVGLGLIGGSFALAAKARWPDIELHAFDPLEAAREWAVTYGAVSLAADIDQLAASSDLIVIAAPLIQFPSIMSALGRSLGQSPGESQAQSVGKPARRDTVVIDLASTKSSTLQQAQDALGARFASFVACHPISGSEQSGALHARADLFQGRPLVITPHADTSPVALQSVMSLWQALGARVVTMDARRHDELFAYLSHAPHALAFSYMLCATTLEDRELALAGGGFRDFTRIAGSNPELWADILLDNRDAVIEVLKLQRLGIAQMEQLLGDRAREPLLRLLSEARGKRAGLA